MNIKFIEQWINYLKNAWWNKDIEKATSLFTKTTKNQEIKNIEFKILAIDNNVVIVEWIFEEGKTEFTGIYEIKFNDNLECIYFRSWEMEK